MTIYATSPIRGRKRQFPIRPESVQNHRNQWVPIDTNETSDPPVEPAAYLDSSRGLDAGIIAREERIEHAC
ncbi:hypothetical protein RRF57_002018 [Xylaria bambusicola]|uniref:Uncharacterized protein n=1 Tax=Xylaria bambusicola TaxID=326684 RepID=A0AAN7Z439_9PEZI